MIRFDRVRALEQWLRESAAEAERLLPDILDLSPDRLRSTLRQRPELRTAGMMHCLLDVANDALDRFPERAHALTSVVVELIPFTIVPPEMSSVIRTLQAEAWMQHASSIHGIGDLDRAQRAIDMARELFAPMPSSQWYLALADIVEAPVLHDLGETAAALTMIRAAAEVIAQYSDGERYAAARLTEASMLWRAGDRAGATAIWSALVDAARRNDDLPLMAHIERRMGTLQLRHGSAKTASELLGSAVAKFVVLDLRREVALTRWHLAEAYRVQARLSEAIAELREAREELLRIGAYLDAACAAVEIADLLLAAGRQSEVASLELERGLRPNVMEALLHLKRAAARRKLTAGDIAAVRRYLEEVRLWPNRELRPPD